jgi:hypothetical protein
LLRLAPFWPVDAEDVGDFQGGARHGGRIMTTATSPAG